MVILDNLHNSSTEAVRRIEGIVGKQVPFEKVDLCDFEAVKKVFEKYPVDSVIHFAGLKVPSCPLLSSMYLNVSYWVCFCYHLCLIVDDHGRWLIAGCWGEWTDSVGVLPCQCWRECQFDQGNGRSWSKDTCVLILCNGLWRRNSLRKHDSHSRYLSPFFPPPQFLQRMLTLSRDLSTWTHQSIRPYKSHN